VRAPEQDPVGVALNRRPQVDASIRLRHHRLVVLNYDDQLASIHELVEHRKQMRQCSPSAGSSRT
jgi:hypothetical protein